MSAARVLVIIGIEELKETLINLSKTIQRIPIVLRGSWVPWTPLGYEHTNLLALGSKALVPDLRGQSEQA